MDAKASGELANALGRRLPSLADDVGCAELPRQRDPVGMPPQEDDLLGTEACEKYARARVPWPRAAITPPKPTAPSPTTATVLSGPTLEATAA